MGPYEQLTAHFARHEVLTGISGALGWDQQTYLPAAGGPGRGEQMAILAGLSHELVVDDRVLGWLRAVQEEGGDDPLRLAACRNIGRAVHRSRALPVELVQRRAQVTSDGFTHWMAAREANDFGRFAPALDEILAIEREVAERIDPDRPGYDVMLEAFDPGTTAAQLRPIFHRLGEGLGQLLAALDERPSPPTLAAEVAPDEQLAWHRRLIDRLGYDRAAGRLDLAEHPFTVRAGPRDVRITTRVQRDDLLGGLGGTVHEAGHAMYEQGLPSLPGTMVGEAASLGLHESQSRFWENVIGRSRPFLTWAAQELHDIVGADAPDAESLVRGALRVQRSLRRVEADEVTYNLHVLVRFELEQALVDGSLAVADLEEAWNEGYRKHLGVVPANPRDGVLQDVHWSGGTFGYFPSYTLGNLYAASLGVAVQEAVPSLWHDVGRGDFTGVLGWLREQVHQHGHLFDAPELLARVVGPRDHVEDLLDYLWSRYGAAHGVQRPG